jgi:hypothetical protein
MFKFFKKNMGIKPIPLSVSISQQPPPYNTERSINNDNPEKSEMRTSKLNKKILNNISAEHDEKIVQEFNDEIMNLLKKSISEKIIRAVIGFHILSSIQKNFVIESQTDVYDENGTKKHFPTTTILVIVKNELIKLILEKFVDDFKKKIPKCAPFPLSRIVLKDQIKNKHNITSLPELKGNFFWFRYELLAKCLPELLQYYDDTYEKVFDDKILSKVNEEIIQCATSGTKLYIYKSDDVEFIYEYIKHHKIFDDIDIGLDMGKITFSW